MPSTTYTANFGRARSGLATVGFRVGAGPRRGSGVGEITPGSGVYAVTLANPATSTYLLWDSGDDRPLYVVEDVDVLGAASIFRSANFGRARAGLTTVGYTLLGQARVAPVLELVPGSGVYGTPAPSAAGYTGPILFDTGDAVPAFAAGFIDVVAALTPQPVLPPGTPNDFLTALLIWLMNNPAITALFPITDPASPSYIAGALPFYFSDPPKDVRAYPYGVLSQVGEQTGGFNLGKAYWVKQFFRFAVFDDDPDRIARVGVALRQQLDTLTDHPLTFGDGRQMRWWLTGGTHHRDPHAVSRYNLAPLWQRSLSYGAQIALIRP
jgi:hypothetical protein